MHVSEAQKSLGTSIPWLYDAMDDRFTRAMGGAPNSEFIVGPDGKIVTCHGWNQPDRLRNELAALVGPIENPTRAEDLNLPAPAPIAAAATGIVPRLKRPEFMRPLRMDPVPGEDGEPFYAKLRAEVTSSVMRNGEGKLYLGFLLDPLYEVHWNNLVAPIHVDIEGPNSVELDRSTIDGPKVKANADADPREFLVTVGNWKADDELDVTVFYYACNDEAGWCKPIKQSYRLTRKPAGGAGFTFRPQFGGRLIEGLDWRDGKLPATNVTASAEQLAAMRGMWAMQSRVAGQAKNWKLYLGGDGEQLTGWTTFDRADPDIHIVACDGKQLRFLQLSGPAPVEVALEFDGKTLSGTQFSPFGDFQITGTRGTADED